MAISKYTGSNSIQFSSLDLSSQINGLTKIFSCSFAFQSKTIMVFWNGIRQSVSEITILSSSSIETSFVPSNGDNLIISFFKL